MHLQGLLQPEPQHSGSSQGRSRRQRLCTRCQTSWRRVRLWSSRLQTNSSRRRRTYGPSRLGSWPRVVLAHRHTAHSEGTDQLLQGHRIGAGLGLAERPEMKVRRAAPITTFKRSEWLLAHVGAHLPSADAPPRRRPAAAKPCTTAHECSRPSAAAAALTPPRCLHVKARAET